MNKIVKKIIIITGVVLGTVVLAAGGYVGYVILSYKRIGDQTLTVDHNTTQETLNTSKEYKALS